jgi:uncharacterized protein YjbI with pentapeptide repeats
MGKPESKDEKQQKEQRFDTELLKKGLRCDLDQYEMLKRCSDKKDMTEWNEWREKHPDEHICLRGKDFSGFYLRKANFMHDTRFDPQTKRETNFSGEVHFEDSIFEESHLEEAEFFRAHLEGSRFQHAKARGTSFNEAHLENAKLSVAHFEDCNFAHAFLENADLISSFLNGTKFTLADLKGCWLRLAIVDGATSFWRCKINRYSKSQRFTDFSGVGLDSARIDPGTKQLLEYNIRRKNWEEWYKEHWFLRWPVHLFWYFSDYGINSWRIIGWFLIWALFFAAIYANLAYYYPSGIVSNLNVAPHLPIWHYFLLLLLRPIYFSVAAMVGFSEVSANIQSIWGHVLVMVQAILGYILLAALVTRFAVLFTSGGPAGEFAKETKTKENPEK